MDSLLEVLRATRKEYFAVAVGYILHEVYNAVIQAHEDPLPGAPDLPKISDSSSALLSISDPRILLQSLRPPVCPADLNKLRNRKPLIVSDSGLLNFPRNSAAQDPIVHMNANFNYKSSTPWTKAEFVGGMGATPGTMAVGLQTGNELEAARLGVDPSSMRYPC